MKKWFSLPATAAALAAGGIGFYMSERVMHIRKKEDSLVISREAAAKRLDLILKRTKHCRKKKCLFRPHSVTNSNRFL